MDFVKPIQPDFLDLRTRADLLEICGDAAGAERLRTLSLEIAREVDLTCYAYQLMWRNKIDAAIEMLERNASAHPDSWNVRHSLGEAYEALGDYYTATMHYQSAATLAESDGQLAVVAESLQRIEGLDQAAS